MLDEMQQRLYIDGKIIELTLLQTILLSVLVENKNKVVTYDKLAKILYGLPMDREIHQRIKTLVARTRKTIGNTLEIKTRATFGYMIKSEGR